MKQKKNKGLIITIAILLIVILILVGIIAYLYFFTDIFRTNKELFFKYTAQTLQSEKGFIENSVSDYFSKKQNNPYENEGKITFNIENSNLSDEEKNLANNFEINYTGKTDMPNSKNEKDITINYSKDVDFPFIYRKTGNLDGIQTKYIGSSFVAIKNNEEMQSFKDINKLLELQNIQFSMDEIKNLKSTYFDNIFNKLDDKKFTKTNENGTVGYKVTISGDEFKNVATQIIEALENDEDTKNKINELLAVIKGSSSKIDSTTIQGMKDQINNWELSNNVEIVVYEKDGNLNKIMFSEENNSVIISKQLSNQEVNYSIEVSQDNNKSVDVNLKFDGLNSDSVNETCDISLDFEDSKYNYNITNNVQFKDSVDIEELSKNNAVVLNDKDQEYVVNLMSKISERMVDVNKVQMEKLEVGEDQNPIPNLFPLSMLKYASSSVIDVDETEMNIFNKKFELYQSTNTKGATVKGLLTTIENSNDADENNKIKEINIDGEEYEATEQNITLIKSNINVDDQYKVEFEKDSETGLIYRAVINKR